MVGYHTRVAFLRLIAVSSRPTDLGPISALFQSIMFHTGSLQFIYHPKVIRWPICIGKCIFLINILVRFSRIRDKFVIQLAYTVEAISEEITIQTRALPFITHCCYWTLSARATTKQPTVAAEVTDAICSVTSGERLHGKPSFPLPCLLPV